MSENKIKKNYEPFKITILNNNNKYLKNDITINGNFWNYLNILGKNLDRHRFKGYFNKTISYYTNFKNGLLTNKMEVSDYFRRCQLLSILQLMAYTNNSLPSFNKKRGLIKIGPSKNGKKNCTLIDDSTMTNDETNEIRDTLGTEDEPHRGYKMFYELTFQQRQDFIYAYDYLFSELKNIIFEINEGKHILIDPIQKLQEIIHYCDEKGLHNVIYFLACEIHDTPHELSIEEQKNLFFDNDNLYKLWNDDFITDNHGKLRILLLTLFYVKKINI